MTIRLGIFALAAALLMGFGAQRAEAATFMGSTDTSAAPDAFACEQCPPGQMVGFRQFTLRGAVVEAPEDGVLVSASANAKRLGGAQEPRIAVLRPAGEDDARVTVVDSAPLPVSSPTPVVHDVDGLALRVQRGDSIGLLVPAGEVDLGVKRRPSPDGGVQSFTQPCEPCGMDGGIGKELLFDAVVEPDVDDDGMGDETQDPDGGGLGEDWEDDWFDDFEEGDELDEDLDEDAAPTARRRLRLLDADRRRGRRGASLLLRVPRAGRIGAAITLPNQRTGEGPFVTILTGDTRATRAGRVRLRVDPTVPGQRALSRRERLRTKVVVYLIPRNQPLRVLMRSARL
jgi:hypothetical protein